MSGDREKLDIPAFDDDLSDFGAAPAAVAPRPASREAPDDDQLNIRGSRVVLDRFRALRKSERYKYADLLEMMMDAYERRKE